MTTPEAEKARGIRGPMSDLYDVFVDWEGRLGREMPALERHLAAVDARRVLDLGCGTGRHVRALRELGLDAHGADASPDMLEQARALLGSDDGLHLWAAGDAPPPAGLAAAAPFDAATCLGNVWPSLVGEAEARAAAEALRSLVRPGGLVLLALKAFGTRSETGNPSLPLLRREHEGRPLFFVRFVDFDVPTAADGARRCDLHLAVLAGDGAGHEPEALLHRASRMRAWLPDELGDWFRARGFADVRLTGPLPVPAGPPRGEDVVLLARVPA